MRYDPNDIRKAHTKRLSVFADRFFLVQMILTGVSLVFFLGFALGAAGAPGNPLLWIYAVAFVVATGTVYATLPPTRAYLPEPKEQPIPWYFKNLIEAIDRGEAPSEEVLRAIHEARKETL